MRRPARFVAGGIIAASVLLPTAGALATSAYAYNGDGELVAHAWAPARNDPGKVAIKDNSGGNWVKVEYYRARNNDRHTLWNKSGSGTTVYSGHGNKVIKIHACEDIDWGPDNCSHWIWV